MRALLAVPLLLLMAPPATAQVAIRFGNTLALSCYRQALWAVQPASGSVEDCDKSLREEALTRDDRAATLDNRGVILDRLGRAAEAEADFARAIGLRPDLGDVYVNRGAAMIRQKQYEAALAQVERGLQLGISLPHVGEYNRAVALFFLGRYREAYEGYRKVLALEPGFAPAVEQLKNFAVTRQPEP